jgi:plasmid stability protein
MAAILVRNLDADVQRRLKERAAANNRSMEAEARAILTGAVTDSGLVSAWLELAGGLKDENRSGLIVDPVRSRPRDLDLS